MSTGSSMLAGSGEIGKGLFGYRRTDVEQLISDRDLMLRHAESRIRSAEARINELEIALADAGDRNARVDEQMKAMRQQLEAMSARNAQVEELAGLVQRASENMTSWSQRVQAIAGGVGPTVDQVRVLVDDVPARVQHALSPLADKMTFLLGLMDDFAEVTRSRRTRAEQASS
jgi:chromosome segregation ATPase